MARPSGVEGSPVAAISVAAISVAPNGSRLVRRSMLVPRSRASTGSPSCASSPLRSARVRSLPWFATRCPPTIGGAALNVPSVPEKASNTM